MKEMLKSSNIQQLKANLEEGLENILRLQRHLNERTRIELAKIEREREKDQARRMTIFTIVLMLASISFPFQVLYEVLKSIWVVILYVAIIPVAFLMIFAFRRKKPKSDSNPKSKEQ
jgi:phage-related protein